MVASSRRLVRASCSACSRSLVAQHFGAAAQQLLLPFDRGDVGIDRHPAPAGQGRALDRDRAPVGAAAFHVVGHEGARGLHPVAHEGGGIVDIAVFAGIHEVADGLLELRAGGHEMLGQAEHRLKGPVADRQPKVGIIDRQGLLDQVQARAGQMIRAPAASHCSSLHVADPSQVFCTAPAVGRQARPAPVTIRKDWEKVRQNLTPTQTVPRYGDIDRPAKDGLSWTRSLGGAP
jgi:hypothetical protein